MCASPSFIAKRSAVRLNVVSSLRAYYHTLCYAKAYGVRIVNEATAATVAEMGSAENLIVIEDDAPNARN